MEININTDAQARWSNSEPFAHENDALITYTEGRRRRSWTITRKWFFLGYKM